MKAGPRVAAMYEALDLLQRASVMLAEQGEMVMAAHLATPIDLLENRLKRTVQ